MALCRAQLRLLADGLGANLSIVYLTEDIAGGGESKLLPLIVYPETGIAWSEVMNQSIDRSSSLAAERFARQLAGNDERQVTTLVPKSADRGAEESQSKRNQLLLPLVSDGTILGLLVTTREAQPWNATEQMQIQQVAQTIALAGIVDRRHNWLAREYRQQQQLQLQQRDLLHNLLHQLRNPLTAIRTFGKLLIKRLNLADPNRGFANSIVRESDRLQELLTHLESAIDLPAMTEAKSALAKFLPASQDAAQTYSANLLLPDATFRSESCQLTDVLDPLIMSAEAIAQDRNLKLHTHIPRDLPLVQAHPAALREVLSNLIDNALKYTPAAGEIDIDVEPIDTPMPPSGERGEFQLQICIRDTGMGIPPQDLDRLFTRHYRGVQAQGSIAGTGLGLAIAKELVTHMHGKISVTSPPPGAVRGTEFMLWLQLVDGG